MPGYVRHILVRYRVSAHRIAENETLIRDVFAELERLSPPDLDYVVVKIPETGEFVDLVTSVGEPSGMTELAAFKRFTKEIRERCEELPQSQPIGYVGRYSGPGQQTRRNDGQEVDGHAARPVR